MWRFAFPAVAVLALVGAACSSGSSSEPTGTGEPSNGGEAGADQDLTRAGEAGGVTVEATWLTEGDLRDVDSDLSQYPLGQFVLLEIDFTTHSGNLNETDMERASALRQGATGLQPEAWLSLSDDSHHREGVLVFPRNLGDGPVELALEIGDEEVALLWEVPPRTWGQARW
jgi:hypothetical protein